MNSEQAETSKKMMAASVTESETVTVDSFTTVDMCPGAVSEACSPVKNTLHGARNPDPIR